MFSSVIASDGTTSHATLIYVKNLENDISSSSAMSHDSIQQIESLSTAAICMAGGDEGEDNWCRDYSTLPGKIVGSNIHIFSFQIHSLAASSDIKFKCDMS